MKSLLCQALRFSYTVSIHCQHSHLWPNKTQLSPSEYAALGTLNNNDSVLKKKGRYHDVFFLFCNRYVSLSVAGAGCI